MALHSSQDKASSGLHGPTSSAHCVPRSHSQTTSSSVPGISVTFYNKPSSSHLGKRRLSAYSWPQLYPLPLPLIAFVYLVDHSLPRLRLPCSLSNTDLPQSTNVTSFFVFSALYVSVCVCVCSFFHPVLDSATTWRLGTTASSS